MKEKKFEIEVKVVTYRIYQVPGKDKDEAMKNFYAGEGDLTDEDDDTFEFSRIEEI